MKKKTVAIGSIALVVLIAILAAVAWIFPIFKVSNVEVNGAIRTDPEQVVEVSGINEGVNLLRVDATSAAINVVELPWVDSVTVNRAFPGTVNVELVEREAAVFVKRSDGDHVYDTQGKPIIVGTPPFGTVEVTDAPEADPQVFPAVISVINAIKEFDAELTAQIATIAAPDQFDMLLTLVDGREIYWGSAENSHDKAVAMQAVMKREGQHWNVSSPSMVTVR